MGKNIKLTARLNESVPIHMTEFYNSLKLEDRYRLSMQRKESLDAKYRMAGDSFISYEMSDDESILGTAAFMLRDMLIDGEVQRAAFGTDLRIAPNRHATRNWPDLFSREIERMRKEMNIHTVFSVLNLSQTQAYNTFIRPRSERREMPRYYLYRKFEVVNIHGFLPFSERPLKTVSIVTGDTVIDPLIDYLFTKQQEKPLCRYHTRAGMERVVRSWSRDFKDFLVVLNSAGDIVGCTGLWNSGQSTETKITEWTPPTLTLYQATRFFSWFGWANPLPGLHEPMQPVFLHHLCFDNPDIFVTLVRTAFERIPEESFLSYLHFRCDISTRPLISWITSHLPHALYLNINAGETPVKSLWPPAKYQTRPDIDFPLL